jgi:hypothetical protein
MKASNNVDTTEPHAPVSGMLLFAREVIDIEARLFPLAHAPLWLVRNIFEVFASQTNHNLHYLINPASFLQKKSTQEVLRTLMLRAKTTHTTS